MILNTKQINVSILQANGIDNNNSGIYSYGNNLLAMIKDKISIPKNP